MTTPEQTGLPAGEAPNDDARPDANTPAPATTDIDDAESAAARAALEAEERGEGGAPPGAPPAATPPAATTPPADPPAGDKAPPPIPYARFAETVGRLRTAEEEANYLRGAVAVLTKQQTAATPGAPPATPPQAAPSPAPQQTIAAKRTEIEALAEKFDAGELTLREYERQRGQLDDQIHTLRVEQMRPAPQQTVQQTSLADQQILTGQIQTLQQQHPYAAALTTPMAQHLSKVAMDEAAAMGRPYGDGPAETMRLRQHVAQLSDFYGPRWGLKPVTPKAPAPGTSPAPSPPGGPQLSPAARARADKLDFAARLPPDTADFGSAGGSDTISDATIETMSDEDIAKLPKATRDRLLAR